MKYVLATGSFNKTDLVVSWQDVSGEGVTGDFPASEVCPALSLRCWGDKALGFFHYTHVMLMVWFIQYALAASGGFCGSNSAAQAEAQTLPGLHSKYNMHEEETSINNLFSPEKMTLFSDLWFCFTTSLGSALRWAIPNPHTENRYGPHDVHIPGAHIQTGPERRGLETSLSIPRSGMGMQKGFPWPQPLQAPESHGLTEPYSFPPLSSLVSNYTFPRGMVLFRSVILLVCSWEQRPCPFSFTIFSQVLGYMESDQWLSVDWKPALHFTNFLPWAYRKAFLSESQKFL